MIIRKLDRDGLIYIYETFMINDFDKSERRPLNLTLVMYDEGKYEAYGFYLDEKSNEIMGYALFYKNGRNYLFDYFAVTKAARNKGVGTQILSLLPTLFTEADCVMGEVEDFEVAKSKEDADIQKRRYNFYLRNGYIDTTWKVNLFGVQYRILEFDLGKERPKDKMRDDYNGIYQSMMPIYIFNEKVKVF